jgi:hypothetical protein
VALSDLFSSFSPITLLSVALLRTYPFFDYLYATLEGLYVFRRAKLDAVFTEVPRRDQPVEKRLAGLQQAGTFSEVRRAAVQHTLPPLALPLGRAAGLGVEERYGPVVEDLVECATRKLERNGGFQTEYRTVA